ncbi:hypothetical protein PR202_ga16203 [Eleusine coracana subsp. coracana]|uniref:Phosphofructokinase domain-containing protein n=1 Tax=Eleusine coracana subsp. coracana TaxID=191504 RepID=A0AAV5CM47_ELECO|nr:hypothetical protein PR202_ga16203 [Eleusine coracana subsp. coracana]
MNTDLGSPRELTGLQRSRALYQPVLPPCLQGTRITVEFGDSTTTIDPKCADIIAQAFPHTFGQKLVHFLGPSMMVKGEQPPLRVGVVFSGRQSPGGHNVIWGTYDALKAQNPCNVLLGFVGGTEGLFAKKTLEITDDALLSYRNQGGFDLLGRTVDRIRTAGQVNAAMSTCRDLNLDGLIIIGGLTSNSDAAQLAETFAERNSKTKVVGVPVTLNGDLKNQFVETTVISQLISNVCLDAVSAGKYYYFVRLMGGKASHVALECALQSHPNMVILGEEVALSKLTLMEITNKICDGVEARAAEGKHHGVLLIPEGLIESIPEMYALMQEINVLYSNNVHSNDIPSHLSPWAAALFMFLPPFIRSELLLHQESDNSAQLSQIDTEQLLAHLVQAEMNKRMAMVSVRRHLRGPGAVPVGKPVIHPSPIDLKGKSYEVLREKASSFLLDDFYSTPGGIQFEGPGADTKPITLTIEEQDYLGDIKILQDYLDKLRILLKPGCSREILRAAISSIRVSKRCAQGHVCAPQC